VSMSRQPKFPKDEEEAAAVDDYSSNKASYDELPKRTEAVVAVCAASASPSPYLGDSDERCREDADKYEDEEE